MTGLLASVKDEQEACRAVAGGADLIDFKDPANGALGGLPVDTVKAGVAAVAGRRLLSATVGDPPMGPESLRESVRRTARTGVDLVKVGLDGPDERLRDTVDVLKEMVAEGVALVAVLFGDRHPNLGLIPSLAAAGFRGVMLDTADKAGGSLPAHVSHADLERLTMSARDLGLLSGLAGSLRREDTQALLPLRPDYLGFRGALCKGDGRAGDFDPEALGDIRARIKPAVPMKKVP